MPLRAAQVSAAKNLCCVELGQPYILHLKVVYYLCNKLLVTGLVTRQRVILYEILNV
jgi:hypothetical protein